MDIEIPGYRIVRTLGKGGMATVYLAIQQSFEREVALKVMSKALADDPQFSERFLREARIVARLVHPHIVTVHDVGVHQGLHYLAMEYVPGAELKSVLHKLDGQQLLGVVMQAADALDYAGRKGYVHRDVKPENIMLAEEGGRVVLMDFGIARAADGDNSMTKTGMALGTPHYMSPEQARGLPVDTRADIYSLGIVFYLMLTGRVPYEADSAVAVGIKHISEPIPRLPAGLAAFQPVLEKMMAKKPEARFQTGAELIAALKALDPAVIDKQRKKFSFSLVDRERTDTPVRNESAWTVPAADAGAPGFPRWAAVMFGLLVATGLAGGGLYYQQFGAVYPPPAEPLRALLTRVGLVSLLPADTVAQQSIAPAAQPASGDGAGLAAAQAVVVPPESTVVDNSEALRALSVDGDQRESIPEQSLQEQLPADAPAPAVPLVPQSASSETVAAAAAEPLGAELDAQSPIAPEPSAAAPEPVAQAVDPSPLERLLLQSRELAALADKQPAQREALLQLYRDIQALDPAQAEAAAGLAGLSTQLLDEAASSLSAKRYERLREQLANYQRWFVSDGDQPRWQQIKAELQRQESLWRLSSRAAKQLEQGNLSAGEDSAQALYQQMLVLDADNAAAREGLAGIVSVYGQRAKSALAGSDWDKAERALRAGLAIQPEQSTLLALQRELQARRQRAAQIASWLEEADALAAQQQWFGADSAAQRYQQILSAEAAHTQAQAGMQRLFDELAAAVDSLLAQQRLDEAEQLLAPALKQFGDDARLQALRDALVAARPALPQLLISGQPLQSLDAVQPASFAADRTLHIGFHYRNLVKQTTVMQAILFDGARSVQIAEVPVVVFGQEGDNHFRIDRPVEGFAEGGYHVDIILDGKRIASKAFTIDN